MKRYSLTHLSNEVLDRELRNKAANEKEATVLAHIAEFDQRKRYLPAAYESMLAYCIGELGLSKDEAKQRIHIARAGHTCSGLFEALEQGRIHLTGLRLLAPHLTPENAGELLSAAAHKSKEDIERLLAERSPRLDVPAMVVPVAVEGAPEHLGKADSQGVTSAPAPMRPCNRVIPLSSESYAVQFTRSRQADQRFRHAQDQLGRADVRRRLHEAEARGGGRRASGGQGARPREGRGGGKDPPAAAPARGDERVKRSLSWFGARIGRKVLPVTPATRDASSEPDALVPEHLQGAARSCAPVTPSGAAGAS